MILVFYVFYRTTIKIYFTGNDNKISYSYFIKLIQIVSNDNYFMNYGLWDKENNTLKKANENLVNFIFDKLDISEKKNMNILDVGCGYGEQDLIWSQKMDSSCKIKALDISEKQIYQALKNNNNDNVIFDICDANFIDLKYKNELFDRIISLESAFHYEDRPKFFKNVNKLLKDDGIFVITDIILKNSYKPTFLNSVLLKIASDFLHIPKQNLIKLDEWIEIISSELEIIEMFDITDETFLPYYKYFMSTYSKNKNLPVFFGKTLEDIFCSIQPFSYVVLKCKKKQ